MPPRDFNKNTTNSRSNSARHFMSDSFCELAVVCISNKVQQHFAKMRSLILTARRNAPQTHLPTPPTPPTLQTSVPLFNRPAFQPTSMALPLFLLTQSYPYLLPSPSIPLLTPSTSLTLTGNLLIDILALTGAPTVPLQLPLRLPTVLPQTIVPSVPTPVPRSSAFPALLRGDQQLQQHQEVQKTSFCYIQTACFKDEAKTRFMCSVGDFMRLLRAIFHLKSCSSSKNFPLLTCPLDSMAKVDLYKS